MQHNLVIDILGWFGALGILTAYFLVSRKKVKGDSSAYQILNLVGAALLIANSVYYGAYPSGALNVAWILIAVQTLSKRNPEQ